MHKELRDEYHRWRCRFGQPEDAAKAAWLKWRQAREMLVRHGEHSAACPETCRLCSDLKALDA